MAARAGPIHPLICVCIYHQIYAEATVYVHVCGCASVLACLCDRDHLGGHGGVRPHAFRRHVRRHCSDPQPGGRGAPPAVAAVVRLAARGRRLGAGRPGRLWRGQGPDEQRGSEREKGEREKEREGGREGGREGEGGRESDTPASTRPGVPNASATVAQRPVTRTRSDVPLGARAAGGCPGRHPVL